MRDSPRQYLADNNGNVFENNDNFDHPDWLEYCRTRDIISNAQPQTVEGILAKARAAAIEASAEIDDVEQSMTSIAVKWAWQLIGGLIALQP